MVKFGVRYGPGTPSPALNFVKKIAQGDLSFVGNFYQKIEIFSIFSFLSPYFYTDNVTIILKRTEDLGISQQHKNWQYRSRGLPVLHCLREVMHIDF